MSQPSHPLGPLFYLLDCRLLVGDDVVGLMCLLDTSDECSYFGHTENGATFRALVEAARIHREQHHQGEQS